MAAYFQHRVAFAANEAIELDPELTLEELADRIGLTPETLGRKLRGWAIADLEEILAIADEIGVDVVPVLQSREDLYPD